MIFFTLDLDTPEEKARFQIDEHTHTASWDFYCECYSYTIRKIIATGLSQDYALELQSKTATISNQTLYWALHKKKPKP